MMRSVFSRAEAIPFSGCWLWTGPIDKCGYGKQGRRLAHRLAWEEANGPIPNAKEVCHRCDIPSCVNPDHLFVGSHAENMKDCVRKGRFHAGHEHSAKTHCRNGHEYSTANTYRRQGHRYCRACDAARKRAKRVDA